MLIKELDKNSQTPLPNESNENKADSEKNKKEKEEIKTVSILDLVNLFY